jgi:hypothetical protein
MNEIKLTRKEFLEWLEKQDNGRGLNMKQPNKKRGARCKVCIMVLFAVDYCEKNKIKYFDIAAGYDVIYINLPLPEYNSIKLLFDHSIYDYSIRDCKSISEIKEILL